MSLVYTLNDLKVLGDALAYLPPNQGARVLGSNNTNIADNIYGINHRQIPTAIPINRDRYGLTFFTRPQLNLSKQNLRNVRLFSPLLSNEQYSYQRIIRSLLDPRMQTGYGSDADAGNAPLVDNNNAFIPILTNNIKSISGWKDIEVPVFTAKEGAYREGYSMVDGITIDYTSYSLTANFRNSRGDLITALFYYWAHYMANVFEGTLMPYPDYIIENMLDYNTRIYRLVLDVTRTKVQAIAATGVSFPTAVSIGQKFDFSSDKPYNDANAEISIPFNCLGVCYQDDILIYEFNQTVQIFNSSMRDKNIANAMTKVPANLLFVFNNRGYPRINPLNYELEWYVFNVDYSAKIAALNDINAALGYIL